MQNVRSRRNWVTALKKRQPRFLRCCNKPQRQRLVTAHASVESRGELCRRNLVTDLKSFRRFAVRIAPFERKLVRFHEQRLVLELFLDPADRWLHRAVVKPVAHAQGEKVLAAVHRLGIEAQMLQRTPRQALQFHRKQPELIEGMVFQRIRGQLRFAQIVLLETVAIDDQDPIRLQVGNVHFQRRRIHGDQHVDGIARRVDLIRGEVQLKAADTGDRPRRGANFRRIVGERGNIIAVERRGIGELAAGDLHAVAGVARETDDRLIEHFALVFYRWNLCECRHSCPKPPRIDELPLSPRGVRLNH